MAEQALSSPLPLDFDIWSLICEELHADDDLPSLLSLSLSSRGLNETATPWLYRSIPLDYDEVEIRWTKLIMDILMEKKPGYRTYVRTLIVNNSARTGAADSDYQHLINELLDLIPLLPGLRQFDWNCQAMIPASLLRSLEIHPTADELVVTVAYWAQINFKIPAELFSQRMLVGLRLNIEQLPFSRADGSVVESCRKLISSAAHLRYLYLAARMTYIHPTHLLWGTNRVTQMENLHSLIMTNEVPLISFRHDPFQKQVQPGRLILRGPFFYAPSLLDDIRSSGLQVTALEVTGHGWPLVFNHSMTSSLTTFLKDMNGLEELNLQECRECKVNYMRDVIVENRHSLRVLKFHLSERDCHTPNLAGKDDLEFVLRACPKLEELQLDIDQLLLKEAAEISTILTKAPQLKKLTLNVLLTFNGNMVPPARKIKAYVHSIAKQIWSPGLEALQLKFGLETEPREHWLVTRSALGDYIIEDADVVAMRPTYRRWERALGVTLHPPRNAKARSQWEAEIRSQMVMENSRAHLDSDEGARFRYIM